MFNMIISCVYIILGVLLYFGLLVFCAKLVK